MKNPAIDTPFGTGNSLAIAIKGSGIPSELRHLAFLYSLGDGTKKMLHLGWHKQLEWHAWASDYYWLEFDNIDPIVQESIVENLEAIAFVNFGESCEIQYSGVYEDDLRYFDDDMKYASVKDGEGLTCATFVLAVMKRLEFQLVEASSWPVGRLADKKWLDFILDKLKSIDRIAHLISQRSHRELLRRYRPEEVVVTPALYEGSPLPFKKVDTPSKNVLKILPKLKRA